jgi:hypothetical protein
VSVISASGAMADAKVTISFSFVASCSATFAPSAFTSDDVQIHRVEFQSGQRQRDRLEAHRGSAGDRAFREIRRHIELQMQHIHPPVPRILAPGDDLDRLRQQMLLTMPAVVGIGKSAVEENSAAARRRWVVRMTGASFPKVSQDGKDKAEGLTSPARIGLVMLTFSDRSQGSSRLHRRDFLRIGGLGWAGLV